MPATRWAARDGTVSRNAGGIDDVLLPSDSSDPEGTLPMSRLRLHMVLIVLVVIAAACAESPAGTDEDRGDGSAADDGGEDMSSIEGDWYLVEAEGPGTDGLPLADRDVTITVAASELAGDAGCNTYSAEYTLDGDRISVGEVVSTDMACEPAEAMDAEQAYLDALGQVERATLEGDELVLTGGSVTLRFAVLQIPTAPEVDGSD